MADRMIREPLEEQFLERLEELPFVTAARYVAADRGRKVPDGCVELETTAGAHRLVVERKRARLTRQLIEVIAGQADLTAGDPRGWLLLADQVTEGLAAALHARDLNFVDLAGNCRLQLGDGLFAWIQGRKAQPREGRKRRIRPAAYQVQFALLAEPRLAATNIRDLAAAAGVGKTAAAEARQLLQAEGFLVTTAGGPVLVRRRTLLERWLVAYADILRPRLLLGRYRTPDREPPALEARIEKVLGAGGRPWAYGGGAAAHRLVGHYRGVETVVHVGRALPPETLAALRAAPDRNGPLAVYQGPGEVALEGPEPMVAHPLLVYAELIADADDRAAEGAAKVRARFPLVEDADPV